MHGEVCAVVCLRSYCSGRVVVVVGGGGWAANGKNMQTSDILFTSLGSLHLLCPLPRPSSLHLSLGGRSHSFSGMLISLCHGPLGHIGRGLDPSPPVSLEPIN